MMHNGGRNYSFTHSSAKLQRTEDGSQLWDKHTQLPAMNPGQLGEMSCELLCCTRNDE